MFIKVFDLLFQNKKVNCFLLWNEKLLLF